MLIRYISIAQRLLLIVVCLACSASSFGEDAGRSNVIEEFWFDTYDGLLRVPVSFHSVPYNFCLDTGSGCTCFDKSLSFLLVQTERQARLISQHGAPVVPLYRCREGRIGSLNFPSLDTVCSIEQRARPFLNWRSQGTMGLDALRGFIIRVDYDRGKLAFLRSVPADAGHRVELDRVYGHIAIRATIGGSVRPLALDTGTRCYGSGILAKRDFDQLLEQGELSVVEKVPTWSDFGMAWHRAAVLRSRVSIAGFEHTALAFVESSQTSSDVCLLGTGFLRRYLVTFDFKSDSAYLAAGAQFHRVDASHDPGGVMLCRCPNGITVSHVARAAKAADVEVGDVLEIANGRRVDSLDEIELARILSTSDAPVTLNFRRANGRTIEFVYDEQAERRRSIDQFNARRGATK